MSSNFDDIVVKNLEGDRSRDESIFASEADLNRNMYMTAIHLMEAAKYLSDIHKPTALQMAATADKFLSAITAPEQKINKEQMEDILGDILNSED